MNIITEPAQPAGIALEVRSELAAGVAVETYPFVGADIRIARFFQAAADQGVDDFLNQLLILGLLAKLIPGIPAHGRGERQAVVQGVDSGGRVLRPRQMGEE
jgi:hypothetical protein